MKIFIVLLTMISLLVSSDLDSQIQDQKNRKKEKNEALIKQVMEISPSSTGHTVYYLQVEEVKDDLNIKEGFYLTRRVIGLSVEPDNTTENILMYVDLNNLDYINFYDFTKFDVDYENKEKVKCAINNTETNPPECMSTFYSADTDSSIIENSKSIITSLGTSLFSEGISKVVSFDKPLFSKVIIDNENIIKSLLFQEIKKAALVQSLTQNQSISSLEKNNNELVKENKQLRADLKTSEDTRYSMEEEVRAIRQEADNLISSKKELELKLSKIQKLKQQSDNEVAELKNLLSAQSNNDKELRVQYEKSQATKEKLLNTNIDLSKENKKLLDQLYEIKIQKDKLEKHSKSLESKLELANKQIDSLSNTTINDSIKSITNNNNILKEQVAILEKEKLELEKKIDSQSSAATQKQLLELEKKNKELIKQKDVCIQNEVELEKLSKINTELMEEISILKNNILKSE